MGYSPWGHKESNMTYQFNNNKKSNIIPFQGKYFKNERGHINSLCLLIWLELIWEICLF